MPARGERMLIRHRLTDRRGAALREGGVTRWGCNAGKRHARHQQLEPERA